MRRNVIIALGLLMAFGAGTGAGVLGILWATGGNAEPSRAAQDVAPTLDINAPTATPGVIQQLGTQVVVLESKIDDLSTQVAQLPDEISVLAPVAEVDESDDAEISEAEVAEAADNNDTDDTEESAEAETVEIPEVSRALYRITDDGTEARFIIDELLLGNPVTVVGTTRRVAGDIIVDFANPLSSQVGTIAINVRTLRTDNEFRDQAIRGQILGATTDDFEFVTFEPTSFENLPTDPKGVGSTVEFQIIGDLTVRGATREVTFEVTLTIDSEDEISGLASTTILWADYGLVINAPPNVSGIEDEVILELEFLAELVEE